MIKEAIRKVAEGIDLSRSEVREVFGQMMDGEVTDAQKSALLIGLRMKGETVEEITGAAMAMRERVVRIATSRSGVIDTCGTGGDGRGTFNVSTIAAIVAAGAGASVAKHGNRAVSSSCGSADVLSALGVNVDLEPAQTAEILDSTGLAFLFAPKFHPAMKAVAGVRRELGLRTIFNVLGPLTNPAFARRQVLGVFAPQLTSRIAGVLQELGVDHAVVVHSDDGLDEISVFARSHVAEVRDGVVTQYEIDPAELGVEAGEPPELTGGDPATNARICREILEGRRGAAREMVVVNTGAALYVSGLVPTIRDGTALARESIDTGRAGAKLQELISATRHFGRRT